MTVTPTSTSTTTLIPTVPLPTLTPSPSSTSTPEPPSTQTHTVTPTSTSTYTSVSPTSTEILPSPTQTTTPSEVPQKTSTPLSTPTGIDETPTALYTPVATITVSPPATSTLSPTEVSLPPEPRQLEEVFLEDFDQTPDPTLWTIPQTWFQYDAVPDVGYGLFVMQSQNEAILNYTQLDDYAIEVEFANNSGTFVLSTQAASTQGYTLMVDLAGTLNLYQDGVLFVTTTVSGVEPGGWRHLRISDFSDVIRISVDGHSAIEFQDSNVSLEELAFSFQFTQGSQPINIGAIDNLRISVEGSGEIQQRAMIQAQSTPPNLNFVPQSANCAGYSQRSPTANFVAYQLGTGNSYVLIESFEVDATGAPIVEPVMTFIASVTGPTPTGSTINQHSIRDPALSPDGTRLAYVAKYMHRVNGTTYNSDGVYILDLTTPTCSISTVAGPNDQLKGDPDWSPDGTMIAYDRVYLDPQGNSINQVIIVDLNTGNTIEINNAENPAWSPDLTNQRLTYISKGASIPRNIWIYDLASNTSTQITTIGFFPGYARAAWSSDGSQLAFEYAYGGDPAMQQLRGIYTALPVFDPTFQLVTPVFQMLGFGVRPVWSADPDGVYPDHIMFTDRGTGQQTSVIEQIMYVSLSSPTNKVQMTFNDNTNTNPDWWAPRTTCSPPNCLTPTPTPTLTSTPDPNTGYLISVDDPPSGTSQIDAETGRTIVSTAADVADDEICGLTEAVEAANMAAAGQPVQNSACQPTVDSNGQPGQYRILVSPNLLFVIAAIEPLPPISADIFLKTSSQAFNTVVRLQPGSQGRIFEVEQNGRLTLEDIVVNGGSVEGDGGGIYNAGELILRSNSVVIGNAATGNGGGIYNAGVLNLEAGTTVSANRAEGNGGGIYNAGGATMTLDGAVVSGNVAIGLGGGIYNAGTVTNNNTITGGCLVGNTALDGSDVYSTTAITANGVWWGRPEGPILRDQGGTSINEFVDVSNPSDQSNGCIEYTGTCTATVIAAPNVGTTRDMITTQEFFDMRAGVDVSMAGLTVHSGPTINAAQVTTLSWNADIEVVSRLHFPIYPDYSDPNDPKPNAGQVWYEIQQPSGWILARIVNFEPDATQPLGVRRGIPPEFYYVDDGDPCGNEVAEPEPTDTLTFTYDRRAAAEYGIAHAYRNSNTADTTRLYPFQAA